MTSRVFLYAGSFILLFWGVAHIVPTGNVVSGFGDISVDNRRIITMEWITEGVLLIFMAALVALAALIDPVHLVSRSVFMLTAGMLVVLTVVSLATGFQVDFLPFKLCPAIFIISAATILLGVLIRPA
jgi:hypothetical protein